MWKKTMKLITGCFCGLMFIKRFPITFPIDISRTIVDFIFHPFDFFLSSVIFISGFLLMADLIRDSAEISANLFHWKKVHIRETILPFSVVTGFVILFAVGFWQTLVLFCFSFIYGMISVDFHKFKTIDP